MNKSSLIAGFIALGLLAGCNSPREDVKDARQDLNEAQTNAVENVNEAKAEASNDVNEAKKDAQEDVNDARKDLQEAKSDLAQEQRDDREPASAKSAKGSSDVKVSAETCAQLASQKEIKPEQRETYKACEDLKAKKH